MQRLARRLRQDQQNAKVQTEQAALRGVVLVTVLAISATLGIVLLSRHVVGEVAPAAITAISATTLGAIAAVGVVLGRRPRNG